MQTRLSPAHPESGKLDASQLDERIRHRAYEIYEERGCEGDRALDDWLEAKAQVLGLARNLKAA
jgi:Protein of unknown function (DUF2934)